MEQTKKFSITELNQYNGKNGQPAYVAYKGKVYDVSESSQWLDGDHLGHMAGQDLTDQMEIAPHADDVLERMRVIGILTQT
ncbi:MAG: cytochrome B5 [Candidatus Bathyarchaeota archaeon]|nr:cytochrome B5 [Candidatus Bathyarchaeota archaeon]